MASLHHIFLGFRIALNLGACRPSVDLQLWLKILPPSTVSMDTYLSLIKCVVLLCSHPWISLAWSTILYLPACQEGHGKFSFGKFMSDRLTRSWDPFSRWDSASTSVDKFHFVSSTLSIFTQAPLYLGRRSNSPLSRNTVCLDHYTCLQSKHLLHFLFVWCSWAASFNIELLK